MVSIRAFIILGGALLAGWPWQTWAESPLSESEQESCAKRFEEKQRATRTYQAELKLTLRLHGLNEPIASAGRVYYQAPDFFLIQFTQPADEFMLIRGNDIYVKKNEKSLMHHRLKSGKHSSNLSIQSLLALFQNGAADLKETFDVQMEGGKGELTVVLKPREGDRNRVREIRNKLTRSNLEIRSIHVMMDESNSVLYEFLKPVRNKPLDEILFQIPSAGQTPDSDP